MLDLVSLTTPKGAHFQFHFEDQDDKALLEKQYSQRELENRLRRDSHLQEKDTGRGTYVHLLINDEGDMKYLTTAEYARWNTREEKDWFHTGPSDVLGALLLAALLSSRSEHGTFTGPTPEQLAKYKGNQKADSLSKLARRSPHQCNLCLVDDCPIRRKNFDQVLFGQILTTMR